MMRKKEHLRKPEKMGCPAAPEGPDLLEAGRFSGATGGGRQPLAGGIRKRDLGCWSAEAKV